MIQLLLILCWLLLNYVISFKFKYSYFGHLRKLNINYKKEKYKKMINNKKMNELIYHKLDEEKLPDYYIPEWVYKNVFSENKKKSYDLK